MTNAAVSQSAQVRPFTTPEEMSQCESLYRRVFGLRAEEGSLNARLLVAVARNSGIVLGAFAGDELVGFAFSFLAQDPTDGLCYQYSQTAAVLPDWQGCGVGRQLKLAQREVALSRGIRRMRWAFDPFKFRNAHFNLDVLGAHGTELARDLYGAHGYGVDAQSSTHRLIADWRLDSEPVRLIAGGHPPADLSLPAQVPPVGAVWREEQGVALLSVPMSWPGGCERADAAALEELILVAIESLLRDGLMAVSCRNFNDEVAVYRFQANDDAVGGQAGP